MYMCINKGFWYNLAAVTLNLCYFISSFWITFVLINTMLTYLHLCFVEHWQLVPEKSELWNFFFSSKMWRQLMKHATGGGVWVLSISSTMWSMGKGFCCKNQWGGWETCPWEAVIQHSESCAISRCYFMASYPLSRISWSLWALLETSAAFSLTII